MSVTTTSNVQSYTTAAILRDYQIHHSPATTGNSTTNISLNPHPQSERPVAQPSTWDSSHRRVPAFRPTNTELDQTQRRVYNNIVERAFITVMFSGVFVNATAAKVWRATGGRVTDGVFKYRIGGEF